MDFLKLVKSLVPRRKSKTIYNATSYKLVRRHGKKKRGGGGGGGGAGLVIVKHPEPGAFPRIDAQRERAR